jgi:cytochrome c-type protein NapB
MCSQFKTSYIKQFIGWFLLILGVLSLVYIGRAHAEEPNQPREELRAFYTAPPVIPHAVATRDNSLCLYCHNDLLKLGNKTTVPMPHAILSNCQQCHVQALPYHDLGPAEPVVSNWTGLTEPKAGNKTQPASPPTIPHRVFLREKCLTCHNPKHPNLQMRSPHPERSNCMQCHVPDTAKEF